MLSVSGLLEFADKYHVERFASKECEIVVDLWHEMHQGVYTRARSAKESVGVCLALLDLDYCALC